MSINLTVGVLFRNNEELVQPFLFFLRKSTNITLSIIAIDQASTDNTFRELKNYLHPQNDIIVRPEMNLGIAQGRNLILKTIKERNQGKYQDLLLMDSDVFIMQNNSIDKMMEGLSRFPEVGIIYGQVHSWYTFKKVVRGICFCLLRKELFERIGEFDPNYRMFWDDTDLMDRMESAGMSHFFAQAYAIHMWGSTTSRGTEGGQIRAEAIKHDKAYFEKKWKGKKLPDLT